MPTLKHDSQYFAMGNPKSKSDEKYNVRWRILLCADENLIVSFEFTHLLRRNYGWDCLSPIRLI